MDRNKLFIVERSNQKNITVFMLPSKFLSISISEVRTDVDEKPIEPRLTPSRLSMKAPMSVLYPAYLVLGVLSYASWNDPNMDTGFYPGSGSLEEIIPYILLLIVFIWGVV